MNICATLDLIKEYSAVHAGGDRVSQIKLILCCFCHQQITCQPPAGSENGRLAHPECYLLDLADKEPHAETMLTWDTMRERYSRSSAFWQHPVVYLRQRFLQIKDHV